MHFLTPHFLHLAWLALIPLTLYLFRKKARRVPVSTLLFFRSLSREHRESAWLRRLKKWLSLLMTLLVILFAVLALGRPVGDEGKDSPGAVIVVVDRSASMSASDETGRTRVEEARRVLRDRLNRLPDQVVVSLVAYDAKAQVLLSRNRNRRECLRLLDEILPLPMEGRPDAALTVVRRLAELETKTQVWHAGDTPWVDQEGLTYEFISVALPNLSNVGITGFRIRPAPLARDRYEGFVQVSAAAANPGKVTATLEITLGGRLAQLRELELEPGKSSALILPMEGVRGQRAEIRLKAAGDCLNWDNAVAAPLPDARPLVVAWVADKPDPFTELAMTSMIEAGRIEMLKGTPAAWPMKDKPDVYVFEQWLPPEWPADRPVIALNPVRSSGPVQMKPLQGAGLPHDSIRSVAPDHPVLFRVSASRLAMTQTSVLALGNSFEPLWMAGTEPVLAAGEANGQRVVVSAFSPAKSEQLALLPAFPLMLGNALYWCAENNEATAGLKVQHPGDLLEETGLLQWTEWNGTQFVEASEAVPTGLLAIQRIGAWQTAEGRSGASILGSAMETDVPAKAATGVPASALPRIASSSGIGNWPQLLIWSLLGVLLLESFLFHRKAVF
ncbi:putative membrane protein (TIGR02226 family) [Prosthecobacter fusiformis]|uniref:Putative membrane protein (TIGR02226 family) n=1 Tax=Prosthecobacter fusiformis TaxID=48464 RepID=A0A4R7S3Z3_9BACT|nr:BatA and WFA domain-containing protein [Prosthecobacter fusiformis]TDU73061.1 putative membrane protein (TIGR02226 family) [Prosthecobacter fusiformis]